MTIDATRPRQRASGGGWSLDEHEAGDVTVFVLRGRLREAGRSARLMGRSDMTTPSTRVGEPGSGHPRGDDIPREPARRRRTWTCVLSGTNSASPPS